MIETSLLALTPQAFKFDKIYMAYQQVKESYSDDIAIANEYGLKNKKIEGTKLNFKITNPSDIEIYEKLIEQYYIDIELEMDLIFINLKKRENHSRLVV